MKYVVQLLAFDHPLQPTMRGLMYREIKLPDTQNYDSTHDLLSAIFEAGNIDETQYNPHGWSISVGDVIIIGNNEYLVCPIGFHKMTKLQYSHYVYVLLNANERQQWLRENFPIGDKVIP